MNKYYQVNRDDFDALPFYSDMDENWEGHALIVKEEFKNDFIAEQVARFTSHLLSILHYVPTRGEYNPFNRIASKYKRMNGYPFGDYIVCPSCHAEVYEKDWNENKDDLNPCCPSCGYKFEMEKEEE